MPGDVDGELIASGDVVEFARAMPQWARRSPTCCARDRSDVLSAEPVVTGVLAASFGAAWHTTPGSMSTAGSVSVCSKVRGASRRLSTWGRARANRRVGAEFGAWQNDMSQLAVRSRRSRGTREPR